VSTTREAPTTTARDDVETRLAAHRPELLAFAYRMTGSLHDAEDAVQETLLRAWRAQDRYDPAQASVRTWLYRIATNVCLTMLRRRGRRALPADLGAPGDDLRRPLVATTDVAWLQPLPDATVAGDPAAVVVDRSDLRLALVAARQALPARQRAVVILRDALGCTVGETAAILATTPAAVHSAHQRARATLAAREAGADELDGDDPRAGAIVDAYAAAFEAADLDAIAGLVVADVALEMPPVPMWFRGRAHYREFMAGVFERRGRRWRLVPTRANGQRALAAYVPTARGGLGLHSYQVFAVTAGGIARTTVFHDDDVLRRLGPLPVPGPGTAPADPTYQG
jgi:RNA polymerase sigma-70 factor (ECF subfamily)